jgi:hypothetical protein
MAAAAQVRRLMGISGLGWVVLQGFVERLLIGIGHRRQCRLWPCDLPEFQRRSSPRPAEVA